jgi:hypothetical protein
MKELSKKLLHATRCGAGAKRAPDRQAIGISAKGKRDVDRLELLDLLEEGVVERWMGPLPLCWAEMLRLRETRTGAKDEYDAHRINVATDSDRPRTETCEDG